MSDVAMLTTDWSKTITDVSGRPALGGAGHIRFGQYLPWLEHAVDNYVLGAPVFDRAEGVFGAHLLMNPEQFRDPDDLSDIVSEERDIQHGFDVVILQRVMEAGVAESIDIARSNGQIVLQEIDDHMWAIPEWNQAFYGSHPDVHPDKNVLHYAESMLASDGIIASTPKLVEIMCEKFQLPTALLENHVEVDKFLLPRYPSDVPRVGWTGAVGWKTGDLELLRPWARMFPWTHGGASGMHASFSDITGAEDVVEHPLARSADYPEMFTFDVGVVPLQKNLFNDCKSWIKGIEYAAAGIPFVSSSAHEYERLRETHGVGYTVRKTKDWIKQVRCLLNDSEMRSEIAAENRKAVLALDVRLGAVRFDNAVRGLVNVA